MREHLNNWYSVGAYVVAKIIAGLPLQLICPTIFIGIAYFMTGQPHDALRFFLLWAILILIAIMSDSLGLLVGALCDVQVRKISIFKKKGPKRYSPVSAGNLHRLRNLHPEFIILGVLHQILRVAGGLSAPLQCLLHPIRV